MKLEDVTYEHVCILMDGSTEVLLEDPTKVAPCWEFTKWLTDNMSKRGATPLEVVVACKYLLFKLAQECMNEKASSTIVVQ